MLNPGVVAAKILVGVRGDPCGARCGGLHQKGHHVHLLHILLPQHRD